MQRVQRKPAARLVVLALLDRQADRHARDIAAVENFTGTLLNPDEEEAPYGTIWTAIADNEHSKRYTNLTREMITTLYQGMQPYIAATRRRGPRPASSWMDSLLCYLMWACSPGKDFDGLALGVGIPSSRFQDNVARVRPILLSTLRSRWLSSRYPPQPLVGSNYPHVGLIIDCHTTECFRPKAPFEEAKIYWDGKNYIYGLKSEVGVRAHPPHYCLFTAAHTVASMHDYEYHKKHYDLYLSYLLKTPHDHHLLPNDLEHRYWATCADKAYIGPASDTPEERRITPKKAPRTNEDRAANTQINHIRVPVEQFFGRMLKSWGLVQGIYRWDHAHFDEDFEICALLTNELIQHNDLAQLDYDFYQKYLAARQRKAEERLRKRQQQLNLYAANKRARCTKELEIAVADN